MFKPSSIAEAIDFCRTYLSNTQGAPARFVLNNCLWEVSIDYDDMAENPLTEWDHPVGSGIDLSNHRDYRPDAFGEAAPVKVPEFLAWVEQDRPEPEFAWVKVDCRACRTYSTYCLSSDSKPSGCVECGHELAKFTFVEFYLSFTTLIDIFLKSDVKGPIRYSGAPACRQFNTKLRTSITLA